MAPSHANGASRAASARTSRAGSTARDIVKKRAKPYTTEKNRVLTKKRRLDLQTSYRQNLPPGYAFLPVGTPDLAERCKELSRKGGYAVNVVNAKPINRFAHNPEKLSHHIARIGYHFRAEVLEEAVGELGYVHARGHWVKSVDLEREQREAERKGAYARTLTQYGITVDPLAQNAQSAQRETPEQVSAAIKELFPKIPDRDLREIVRHAWEEGTDRVGTNNNLDLPRRVQLAVIARIRHEYTDYDRLLRAFEWKESRQMVEPECLHKLIEWRGENEEDDDDDGFEEIVRETIIIDDDDNKPTGRTSDAHDEDSMTELEPGETSDTSIEITHHVAADQDLGAESSDERSRQLLGRYQPQPRVDPRTSIAKQKITAARNNMRARAQLPHGLLPMQQAPQSVSSAGEIRYVLPPTQNGQRPAEVVFEGRRLQLIPEGDAQPKPRECRQQQIVHPGAYSQQHVFGGGNPTAQPALYAQPPAMQDRPIASIERGDGPAQLNNSHAVANGLHPITPDSSRGSKRRWMDDPGPVQPASVQHVISDHERRVAQRPPSGAEVVSLVSPDQRGGGSRGSPFMFDGADDPDRRGYAPLRHGAHMHATAPPPYSEFANRPLPRHQPPHEPQPYDPSQPLLRREDAQAQPTPGSEQVQYVKVYRPEPYQGYARPPDGFVHAAAHYGDAQPPQNWQHSHPPPGYSHYQPAYSPYVQQPIHGAPAPVQQMPAGRSQTVYLPPSTPSGAGYGPDPNVPYSNATDEKQVRGDLDLPRYDSPRFLDGANSVPPRLAIHNYFHGFSGQFFAGHASGATNYVTLSGSF